MGYKIYYKARSKGESYVTFRDSSAFVPQYCSEKSNKNARNPRVSRQEAPFRGLDPISGRSRYFRAEMPYFFQRGLCVLISRKDFFFYLIISLFTSLKLNLKCDELVSFFWRGCLRTARWSSPRGFYDFVRAFKVRTENKINFQHPFQFAHYV